MAVPRSPYTGPSRKLVLAFDIGTVYSRVSYTLLEPGSISAIKHVGRYLDSRTVGVSGVPSTLYYDHDGSFRGVKGTLDDDEAENLYEVRWWKLKLSPDKFPVTAKENMTTDLPKGKSLQDVFADFIRYLFDSAKAFIQGSELMGKRLWESLEVKIDIVLSHPNGWEGCQQEFLRESVAQALIFTEEEAHSRVSFVTEGEATVNFLLADTKPDKLLKPRHKVAVIDAGDGTIDISAYTVKSTSPLEVEEFQESQCFYQGADFVTAWARAYAQARFKNSRFDNELDLAAFTENFDASVKKIFWDSSHSYYVKFCSPRDNDARCGIKCGKLILPGKQVEKFFEPSVNAIVEGINNVTTDVDPSNIFVFLIGSHGESPWIFREVGRRIAAQGLKLSCPDTHTNKAVAFGAISYYLHHFAVGRLVGYTYGTLSSIEYDPSDPEHRKRSHKKYLGMTGEFQLDMFSPIIYKGTRIFGTQELRGRIVDINPLPPVANRVLKFPIIRYSGTLEKPQWMDEEEGTFKTVSHISVDTANVPCTAGTSRLGFPSFKQELEVICTCGQTEFKVQLSWMEEGIEKRDTTVLYYDEDAQ